MGSKVIVPSSLSNINLVDNSFSAFSYSVISCKMFEIAIRKPREKMKHRLANLKSAVYAIWLLFINHMGTPSYRKDLTCTFIMYSILMSFDITLLVNFTFHCFAEDNFEKFGFIFCFVLFAVPYLSAIFHIIAAFSGEDIWLRVAGNMNSMLISINYPLTFIALMFMGDAVEYKVMLVLMTMNKCVLSFITA